MVSCNAKGKDCINYGNVLILTNKIRKKNQPELSFHSVAPRTIRLETSDTVSVKVNGRRGLSRQRQTWTEADFHEVDARGAKQNQPLFNSSQL